ncbi:unnamed protein product [Lymnaea stagnalis]|uniref:Coiled-coil domain-containing protein 13 n=1 Tax=Lymnaea stagnalis TaxID=6523 RepID=A0AAV2H652_LYMST
MENADLKVQFQHLQDQQQQKLLERRKRKEEANKNIKSESKENVSQKFGVNDELGLKLSDHQDKNISNGYISEELVDHLNDQIRQIKDENGRLYKLLNEKDFEIRQVKKKADEFKNNFVEGPITNETAATKIIELSKKVRELTSEKESEKTKCKQLQKKCHELQLQLQSGPALSDTQSVAGSAAQLDNKEDDGVDIKALQERLKQSEVRLTDFRNQCQSLRQELKIAHKVMSQELGENVNIQSLLNETSNWRGRAQQIIALQQKVDELKAQLEGPTSELASPNNEKMSARKREEKYREDLKRVERERKEAQEVICISLNSTAQKLKVIEAENESLRDKLDAAKARNKVLANENKTLKPQVQTLLKKSRNDDEFIDALMKQQAQLKQLLDEHTKKQSEQQLHQQQQLQHMSMKSQQDNNIVEQLKAIATQKETQVKMLEMELQHLRMVHAQNHNPNTGNSSYMQSNYNSVTDSRPTTASDVGNVAIRSRDLTHSALSSTRTMSRASSRPISVLGGQMNSHNNQEELSNLHYQCQELEIMSRALKVEKDKMTELVKVLQDRLSEETQKLSEAQSELQAQKRLCVEFEKRLGRFKLEATKKRGSSKGGNSARDLSNGDEGREEDDSHVDNNELQTRLDIQKDENETLKAALKRTLKAKEEDLKVYSSTLEETKQVFLQALRQMKERHSTS